MRLPGRSFWIAQVVGWGSYSLILWLSSIPMLGPGKTLADILPMKAAMGAGGFLVSLVLYVFYHSVLPARATTARLVLAAVCGSAVMGAVWSVLVQQAMSPGSNVAGALKGASSYGITLLAWTALLLTFRTRGELEKEVERALRADALASEARLQMLRYQVNPHFLFNALNSIRALIDEDKARAREMVTRLAELFRYSLVDTRGKDVPLADELAAIRNYVEIQRIRFEERLVVTFETTPAAEAFVLPGFLVHPLVENAVKYGMETSPMPLTIAIRASIGAGGALEVVVWNSGRWVAPGREAELVAKGAGVGLANVRERLRQSFGDGGSLAVGEGAGGVEARLVVRRAA